MAALSLPVALQWHQKPFREKNAAEIAEQPGVYAFAIAHGLLGRGDFQTTMSSINARHITDQCCIKVSPIK